MLPHVDPRVAALHFQETGNLTAAEQAYRELLLRHPEFAEAHSGLATALLQQGKLGEAVHSLLRALEINPNLPGACKLLGHALTDQGHFELALNYLQRAVQVAPDDPGARMNLGATHLSLGGIDDGRTCFRQALELDPRNAAAYNNLLSGMQYLPGITLSELYDAHREFDRRFSAHLQPRSLEAASSANDEFPLRLGFVSPDFRNHPVSDFLIRAFENFDRRRVATVCYCDNRIQDERTARFQAASMIWRDVVSISDEALAQQIRADQIDVLFDLAGHSANNRLLVFARKPAPIQITWIGYEGTTGVSAMDYILADRYEIPVEAEQSYCERVLRMPDSYVCYEPPTDAPAVTPLPALERGYVTFGSFNNPKKINSQVIAVWSNILRRLPTAGLTLKYNGMDDPGSVRRLNSEFARQGTEIHRVNFLGYSPYGEHFADYRAIDIALDPFPFGGGVTTCEALWMGVPVITCPGETFASRHSLCYLSSIGLTETIARDLDAYVALAVTLAQDLSRLASLRANLREQMAAAPLCDGPRFADNLTSLLTELRRNVRRSS